MFVDDIRVGALEYVDGGYLPRGSRTPIADLSGAMRLIVRRVAQKHLKDATFFLKALEAGSTIAAVDPVGELAKRDPTTRDEKDPA